MSFQRILNVLVVMLIAFSINAQVTTDPSKNPATTNNTPAPQKWYDKISLRGYAQFRYNRLLETNPDYKCEQCDRGIGSGQSFGFRRGRMIFSGNPGERLFIYLQFDYAADASSTAKHFLQVRDAYFDYNFDKKKEFRVRFGQSKVPYGFENMQSSSNRPALDRSDAINSAAPNERDFGMFLYYAPQNIRKRFQMLLDEGLKGSGDYGVVGIGLYNGQVTNKPELNDNLHAVGRIAYPFQIGGQIIEPGIYSYTGKFTLPKDQLTTKVKINSDLTYLDQRVGGQLMLYPQPIGFLAEYNVGKAPGFNPATDSIEVRNLKGGSVLVNYRLKLGKQTVLPYVRYHWYEGGKKQELDARYHNIKETNIGIEWQPFKYLELTAEYIIGNRITDDFKTKGFNQKGNYLRIQAQVNY